VEEELIVGGLSIENHNSSHASLFPNPVIDILSLENIETSGGYIIDLNGRVVMEILNLSSEMAINVSHLSSGMYLLKLQNGNTFLFNKL
jgi:hypothetical protein